MSLSIIYRAVLRDTRDVIYLFFFLPSVPPTVFWPTAFTVVCCNVVEKKSYDVNISGYHFVGRFSRRVQELTARRRIVCRHRY